MSINLESLNSQELDALISAAAEQKKRIHRARLQEVRAKITALARQEGYTIEELFGDSRAKATNTRPVAPKYRNPKDSAQTWTGRGKQPLWVREAIAGGKRLEDLLI